MYLKNLILSLFVLYIGFNSAAQTNPKPFVIPSLQQWKGGQGFLALGDAFKITYSAGDTDARKAAKILVSDLRLMHYPKVSLSAKKATKASVALMVLAKYDSVLGQEGYRFDVQQQLVISANTYRGLFWGTRTLLQLLEQGDARHAIPKGTAVDFPSYPVRGFMLDDGRKFFSLEFLRRYVRLLSYYKMTDFQIHLNDNGFKKYFRNNWDSTYAGFALESSTYPALNKNGEFYTKQQFRDLQRMAQDYGVNIIPEIDLPAHALAVTRAMPELGSRKYGMDHLDLAAPQLYEVVENIYKEYVAGPQPVFAGPDVHIGTDEYTKAESERFRAFTDHLIRYVQGYGKEVRLWGALTHVQGITPVTSRGVKMNIWYNGYADPVEMKKQGYHLISTPDGYLYIVPAAGYYYDYLNLPMLYEKWVPAQIGDVRFDAKDSSLLGGMFAEWNDIVGNGISAMDVHDRVFPAVQVLAEKMWSSVTDTTDYGLFASQAWKIGEGPGLHMLGRFPVDGDSLAFVLQQEGSGPVLLSPKGKLVCRAFRLQAATAPGHKNAYRFGPGSYLETRVEHIGFGYRIDFSIAPAAYKPEGILFSDPAWQTFVKLLPDGRMAFYRENYADTFRYRLPFGKWTEVSFSGDRKSVSLYINGQLQERLAGYPVPCSAKDTLFRVQTLFFPLKMIGSANGGFRGRLADLKVYLRREAYPETK